MCTHTVHSEGNQLEILVSPIEHSVEIAQRSEPAIVGTGHVVQEMQCRKSHKGDSFFELVANADSHVLIHVKFIGSVVMLLYELHKVDGFG